MSKTSDNKKITQGVAVSDKDIESFRKLVDLGVNTEIHMVPNHKPEPIMNYL